MRVCLMVEGQEGISWEQWLGLAEAAEEGGLEGLFTSDHYLSGAGRVGRGSLDAWSVLTGLAARTTRIRLGTMVSPVTFRPPSVLAGNANAVDHVSGGRVELGIGAGWYELEHRAFGFPFPPLGVRMEMFEEQLEIIHRQWTEDEVTFEGKHYRLERCPALPRPVQRPRPPIIVGGAGKPRAARAAARFAQEYNTTECRPDEAAAIRGRLDDACAAAGRDPGTLTFSVMATCVFAETRAALLERVGGAAAGWGDDRGAEAVLEEHRDDWIAGTTDEVVAHLTALREAGVTRVMLRTLDGGDASQVRELGRRLLPLVANL